MSYRVQSKLQVHIKVLRWTSLPARVIVPWGNVHYASMFQNSSSYSICMFSIFTTSLWEEMMITSPHNAVNVYVCTAVINADFVIRRTLRPRFTLNGLVFRINDLKWNRNGSAWIASLVDLCESWVLSFGDCTHQIFIDRFDSPPSMKISLSRFDVWNVIWS